MSALRNRSKRQMLAWLREHVRERDGCRIWAGALHTGGYPLVCWMPHGRALNARLLLARLAGRRIPERPVVWSTCGHRDCMHEHHIVVGTRAQMIAALVAEKRFPRGARRSMASATAAGRVRCRLGVAQLRTVQQLLAQGETQRAIGERFGVTAGAVWHYLRRWRRCGLIP